LKKGTIKVTDKSSAKHSFDINGGVVEVHNNKVIVLAE
jgi:F0F1-type ATP synthase epsilon subunit